MKQVHTVMVIMEAKPGKIEELKQALIALIKPSRSEKTCLEYRLHQDNSNPAIFILYENWENEEAHQMQFSKPYIQDFVAQTGDMMTKPFEVYFAKELA